VPVPDQRDPVITQAKLEIWLSKQLADATDVRVLGVQTPATNGFSSETLIFDAEWASHGRHHGRYVAKVAPTGHQIFPEPRFGEQYRPDYAPGTRDVRSAAIGFQPPGGGAFEVSVTPLLPVSLMAGTGYGLEPDWRHGMYQGPGLVVQGVTYDLSTQEDRARMWGMVDSVARFECTPPDDGGSGETAIGYGLFEHWALGEHKPTGLPG
jgi:hypothetical protein